MTVQTIPLRALLALAVLVSADLPAQEENNRSFSAYKDRIENCLQILDYDCVELNFRIATQKADSTSDRSSLALLRKRITASKRDASAAEVELNAQRDAQGIVGGSLGGDIVTPSTSQKKAFQTSESLAREEKARSSERFQAALSRDLGLLNSQLSAQAARISAASRGTSVEEENKRASDNARYQAIVSESKTARPETAKPSAGNTVKPTTTIKRQSSSDTNTTGLVLTATTQKAPTPLPTSKPADMSDIDPATGQSIAAMKKAGKEADDKRRQFCLKEYSERRRPCGCGPYLPDKSSTCDR